jgi:hypothetical protein
MWFKSDTVSGPDGKVTETHVVTCFFMSDRADYISSLPESEAIRVCLDQVGRPVCGAVHFAWFTVVYVSPGV